MTLLTDRTHLTADEFLLLPDAREFELVDGRLVERRTMGVYANLVAAHVLTILSVYCREQRAGRVFNSETLYRCWDPKQTFRKPDVSVILRERLSAEQAPAGFFVIRPDLAVEVVSPNDLAYEVEEKLADYRRAGVPLVWVLHPNTRTVRVHRAGQPPTELDESQEISGAPVLPGFTYQVADLFPDYLLD